MLISVYFQIIKMERQFRKNDRFQHFLLFAFNKSFKAAKAASTICAVYRKGAIAERSARDWYDKFKI